MSGQYRDGTQTDAWYNLRRPCSAPTTDSPDLGFAAIGAAAPGLRSCGLDRSAPVSEHFFEEQKEQSQVKTAIVTKYFWAWAKVITSVLARGKNDQRIAYVDLFAGPGRYEDGAKSTPLLILEQAIA